jgi:Ni/Fe-hydrogenase subunit HybB-like protein
MYRDPQTSLFKFWLGELKPKGKILTPFNIIAAVTILAAAVILFFRFSKGLGTVVHPDQDRPWGLWINFNVITGVAFAGGAYVVTFMVYILGLEKYRSIVRATVLYALLAYMFYAGALLLDLGRPWNVINPIIGNSFGISAVLFLVAWHFILYMGSLLIEFLPTATEWATLKRGRRFFGAMTLAVVIFGIALSTLHQSGVGALFLMAEPKIHPLWYSEFIPILFFISSIFAGLSLVIILETIGRGVFREHMSDSHRQAHGKVMMSLARICSISMFVYLFMVMLVFLHGKDYNSFGEGWGAWWAVEVLGFVLLPCMLFLFGYKQANLTVIRVAAVMSIVGIILNRLNISTISYNWFDHSLHWPTWMEMVVSLAVIFVQLLVFRWIVRRMPVYRASPAWVSNIGKQKKTLETTNKWRNKKWKASA